MLIRVKTISVFLFLILFALPAFAQERCHECGMAVDAKSPFMSYAALKDSSKVYFCDIGDMLVNVLKKKKTDADSVFVKDYKSREWIPARSAFYVHSKKFSTPMEWGIAAFKDKADAEAYGKAYDFTGARSFIE
jgi:copper chaperone NosL